MRNIWQKELTFPEDIYYSPELLWAKDLGENKIRMGISDLGVKSVKSLIYIRFITPIGKEIKKGDALGIVETSKMVWEIITPLSGKLISRNQKLSSGNPAILVKDPYGEGWLVEMELIKWPAERESLLQAEVYYEQMKAEAEAEAQRL